MKKIIDKNYFQDEELTGWLSGSKQNYVVLTDFAAMEAYKGDTVQNIFPSMKILSHFPDQVLVLKNTQKVCRLNMRGKGLQRRLVDDVQTREFGEYCKALRKAKEGDRGNRAALMSRGEEANQFMDTLLRSALNIKDGIEAFSKMFTSEELKIIRRHGTYTPQMTDKFRTQTYMVTAKLFIKFGFNTLPSFSQTINSFIFRYSLCGHLLALRWISHGGVGTVNLETIRNDAIDMNYITFATYFDGFLSNDRKASSLFAEVNAHLKELSAYPFKPG